MLREYQNIYVSAGLAREAVWGVLRGDRRKLRASVLVFVLKLLFASGTVRKRTAREMMQMLHMGHRLYKESMSACLELGWITDEGGHWQVGACLKDPQGCNTAVCMKNFWGKGSVKELPKGYCKRIEVALRQAACKAKLRQDKACMDGTVKAASTARRAAEANRESESVKPGGRVRVITCHECGPVSGRSSQGLYGREGLRSGGSRGYGVYGGKVVKAREADKAGKRSAERKGKADAGTSMECLAMTLGYRSRTSALKMKKAMLAGRQIKVTERIEKRAWSDFRREGEDPWDVLLRFTHILEDKGLDGHVYLDRQKNICRRRTDVIELAGEGERSFKPFWKMSGVKSKSAAK